MQYARNPTTVTLKHEWEISLHKSSNISYPGQGTAAGWIQGAIGMICSQSFLTMGSLRTEGSRKTSIAVCQGLIEVIGHLPVHVYHRVGSQVLHLSRVYG